MLADLGFSARHKTLDLRGLKTNKKVSHRPACVGESIASAAQVGDVSLTFSCFQIMSESSSSLLCVIFDINPLAWGLKTLLEAHASGENNQRQETIVQGLDATLTFINSFLLMTHGNQVAVVGVHPEASGTVYLISARLIIESIFSQLNM